MSALPGRLAEALTCASELQRTVNTIAAEMKTCAHS